MSISAPDSPAESRARAGRNPADQSVWMRLMERSARGDQSAFAALYDATRHLVYTTALRILTDPSDAEEVTLDVYMQVWRTAKDYTDLRGSVGAWLVVLTRCRAIDRLRSRSLRSRWEEPFHEFSQFRSADSGPDLMTELSQRRRRIASALDTLPVEQREALELAFFSGLTHSELAARLKQPLGTVKSRVRQAMIRIRELLVEVR